MRDIGRVVAVTPNRNDAEETVADLRFHGVHADVRSAGAGSYGVEDETFREQVRAAAAGLVLGMFAGAGLALLVVFTVPAVGDWGALYKVVLVAGLGLLGTVPAMMWRMGRRDRGDDDPATIREVTAADWLVVVHEPHDAPLARHVVARHDLLLLDDEEPRPSHA